MRIVVIGNPIAGRGKGLRMVGALKAALEGKGHEVSARLTQAAGDARRWAGELDANVDRLVVVGGDGTINEVLNGLADPARVPLAIVGMGTANVLSRELKLPRSAAKLARMVEAGAVRRIDLGMAGERRFLSLASAGFDSMVVQYIHENRSGKLGWLHYVLPIFLMMARYVQPRFRVTVNEQEVHEGAMVTVSHVKRYALFMSMTDQASYDSGVFDVAIFRRGSIGALWGYALSAAMHRISRRRDVIYLKAKRIRIESIGAAGEKGVPMEVDGDFAGYLPVEITVQPGAVALMMPGAGE